MANVSLGAVAMIGADQPSVRYVEEAHAKICPYVDVTFEVVGN
jgi:hypothetical protein